MKNELLKSIFATESQQAKFIVSALEKMLGDEETEALLEEMMPKPPTSQAQYKGNPVSYYSGLGRAKLVTMFGLTDAEVDEVYVLLGVEESADEKSAAAEEIKAINAGNGGAVVPDVATTEMAVTLPELQAEPGAAEAQVAEEAEAVAEDKAEAEESSDLSYASLMKLEKADLLKLAEERGLEFTDSMKEQQLASLISKDAKAKSE